MSVRLPLLTIVILMCLFLNSCQEEKQNPYENISLEAFSALSKPDYAVNSRRIRENLERLIRNDIDSMSADRRTRGYYRERKPFMWIDRHGVDDRADTLLYYIAQVADMGLSTEKFRLGQMQKDLQRIRTLDVGGNDSVKDINRVLARLEYNLTKAYFRYAAGMSYGFVNPAKVLNTYDVQYSDSLRTVYHKLYDVKIDRAGDQFYAKAIGKVAHDSVGFFLSQMQPHNSLYRQLQQRLLSADVSSGERVKLLCNMERCRWREGANIDKLDRYVLVNIPAFKLRAVCPDSTMEMRVGCGTYKTKTPLLTSEIMRMDINPEWIVPRSIIEKDVARHAGSVSYFERQRMYVRDRKTGKRIPPYAVTWGMLHNERYLVIQEGGEGNSLGRIIFRFENNFSVFLHDTSSRSFFSRDNRGVSHGCVRVERPLDLALFLLDGQDEEIIEKVTYSMTARLSREHLEKKNEDEDIDLLEEEDEPIDRSKLIRSVKVEPKVPLFIAYYTVYPDLEGQLRDYPDVYGYDKVIYRQLRNYLD